MSKLTLFFRIIYRTLYFFLQFILAVLLLVPPADVLNQARIRGNLYTILIIAACYVFTILFVAFVHFMRLYLNRSIINSIPKSWIPIEKGDVNKRVRKMIGKYLGRSAAIAYAARPRVMPSSPTMHTLEEDLQEKQEGREAGSEGVDRRRTAEQEARLEKTAALEEELGINLPPHRAVWGEIEHPGWSSPNLQDLPDLQYCTVISELPNLIEAKALTLAPPDPLSETDPPLLDPEMAALLQRAPATGLRAYLVQLTDLGVLGSSPSIAEFNAAYEHARFATRPISNTQFRSLMHHFAELLRAMQPMDPIRLVDDDDDDEEEDGYEDEDEALRTSSDIDNDAPIATNPTTPRSHQSRASRESSPAASFVTSSSSGNDQGRAPSNLIRPQSPPARTSSANTWQQYRTAPNTPKSRLSRRTAATFGRSSSTVDTFAQTRHPYPASQASSLSLRTASSSRGSRSESGSGGSVIRLSTRGDGTDLPYVIATADGTV